ncbi:polymorphic toxin type 44 domain-containing protein [Actinoallomurus sp. NPDC052308]|uniref:polymorphic toxin type 44 domain-containing protein n=1 Tax=Actinoallomurus sp. NPDC052308 TaxID=3155530 RepID=UPI003440EA8E
MNYDVWSNIHYGYVGMAAGFDETTVQDTQQKIDNNDPADNLSVQVGIGLYKKAKPDRLTRDDLAQAVTRAATDRTDAWVADGFHVRPRPTAGQTLPYVIATADGTVVSNPSPLGPTALTAIGPFDVGDKGLVYCADGTGSDAGWYRVRIHGHAGYVKAGALSLVKGGLAVPAC